MGFVRNRNNQNSNVQAAAGDDSWKATAFLNLYLPAKDGSRRKIGFIALKQQKATDRQLIEWLSEDESRVAKLTEKLIVEFNLADAADKVGLSLD